MTKTLGIIGCGIMGRGIAQLALLAGHSVVIMNRSSVSGQHSADIIADTLTQLAQRGKITDSDCASSLARLSVADHISDFGHCDIVLESIRENFEEKLVLFQQLTAVISPQCLVVTNTSSLSVTRLAESLAYRDRFAGLHFFNPPPLMKVIELIPSMHTDPAAVDQLMAWAKTLKHTVIQSLDAPGFTVNHAGRALVTESLRLLQENIAMPWEIDQILCDTAGFRMGPFQLLDLMGLDTSHPVMESIFQSFYGDPRYRPQWITAQMLAGGLLGRKTGRGFYQYQQGKIITPPEKLPQRQNSSLEVYTQDRSVADLCTALGLKLSSRSATAVNLVSVTKSDATVSSLYRDNKEVDLTVGIDTLWSNQQRIVLLTTPATTVAAASAAYYFFADQGLKVSLIRDSVCGVTQRIVAMIVNTACELAQQNIASPNDIDLAVKLALGYPQGPLAWGDQLGPYKIMETLKNLQSYLGDDRYRPSLWLQRRALLGLSLLKEEI